jgi:DNA ligase (NAD+)
MDIPMIGRTASRELSRYFRGDLNAFETAVDGGFDFTQLPDFGEILHRNIREWFMAEENRCLWEELQRALTIEKVTETTEKAADSPFAGRTVVVTGTLIHFTRDAINAKIEDLGAKAGSKRDKARLLGIPILTERQFLEMAAIDKLRIMKRWMRAGTTESTRWWELWRCLGRHRLDGRALVKQVGYYR